MSVGNRKAEADMRQKNREEQQESKASNKSSYLVIGRSRFTHDFSYSSYYLYLLTKLLCMYDTYMWLLICWLTINILTTYVE